MSRASTIRRKWLLWNCGCCLLLDGSIEYVVRAVDRCFWRESRICNEDVCLTVSE